MIVQTNVKEIESEYQQLFSPQSHRMTIAEPRPVALYQVTEGLPEVAYSDDRS